RTTEFVARVNPAMEVVSLNRGGRRMLGYGEREPIPRALSAYYPAPAAESLVSRGIPGARRDGLWFAESVLRQRDGIQAPVSQFVLAHQAAEGKLDQFSVVARDISRRRAAERALSESERRYRQLVQRLPAAAYTCDAQGVITLYNEAAVALWGREPEAGKDRW